MEGIINKGLSKAARNYQELGARRATLAVLAASTLAVLANGGPTSQSFVNRADFLPAAVASTTTARPSLQAEAVVSKRPITGHKFTPGQYNA